MKFPAAVLFLGALGLAPHAVVARETNGMRMARGLPPLPPPKLFATRSGTAKRSSPSARAMCPASGQSVALCCADAGTPMDDEHIAAALAVTGMEVPALQMLGADCYGVSQKAQCTASDSAALCCASYDGNVALDCANV